MPNWTFLSNHAHVLLLLIARDPQIKLREVAERIGITERAVQRIVADLVAARYLERERSRRRNHYKVDPELPMRHPVVALQEIGTLIELIMSPGDGEHQGDRRASGANGASGAGRPQVRAKVRRTVGLAPERMADGTAHLMPCAASAESM